jgi:molybdopterin synthase sulfur carrier subunit
LSVTVKFFASLREQIGRPQASLEPVAGQTVADVWSAATGEAALAPNVRAAVNLEYVDMSHVVADGDEVAFFPPVTGG